MHCNNNIILPGGWFSWAGDMNSDILHSFTEATDMFWHPEYNKLSKFSFPGNWKSRQCTVIRYIHATESYAYMCTIASKCICVYNCKQLMTKQTQHWS